MAYENNELRRTLCRLIGLMAAALAIGALGASGPVQGQGKPTAAAAKPAGRAEIAAVNVATGLVTAWVKATKRTFQFKVNDTAVLQSLKPGQSINVEKGTGHVFQSGHKIGSLVPRIQDTYGNAKAACIQLHNRTGLPCDCVVSQNYTHPGETNPHDDDQVEYECRCS